MKTYTGSLQKRGKCWYLVTHVSKRQRWFALKTHLISTARMRATKLAPADSSNEEAWLEHLVRMGEAARRQLALNRIKSQLTWDNIGAACSISGELESSPDSRRCHARWIDILSRSVDGVLPGDLTQVQANAAMEHIRARYVSAPRMLRFFRHAWRVLGLNEAIWPKRVWVVGAAERVEHYRRLTVDEVRKVYRYLAVRDEHLAAMVLIGYSTGLRLSDVAQLEMSEMDGAFLRVCPNKTRRCKPMPLKIPLTPEARAVILRLSVVAAAQQRRFLFDDRVQKDVSRHLSRAFRACGVGREGKGRASFHSLRATFISLMDEAGVPPHITDSITGHGGGGMHARYTQPSDAALAEAVARAISPLVEIS